MQTAIREISPPEAQARHAAGAKLIDVREQVEWDAGHVAGALFIPRGQLEQQIEAAVPDKATEIVLYCRSGARSGLGTQQLQQLGYTDVTNMAGGILAWEANSLPIEAPAALTPAQQSRYSRHLLIPEVGTAGQVKLLESKVLLVGAGGLGSPSALYLAAAGVGTLGIVDFDVVPGIMGLLQANEVLKVLLGIGEPLVGRLLLFDALDGSFSELRLERDPKCPVCSDEARAARERGEFTPPPVFGADQPFALGGPIGGIGGAAR